MHDVDEQDVADSVTLLGTVREAYIEAFYDLMEMFLQDERGRGISW